MRIGHGFTAVEACTAAWREFPEWLPQDFHTR